MPGAKRAMEAIALYDFHATAEDEISFKEETDIIVLNMEEDKHWYRAQHEGCKGLIPKNYIQMKDHEWYYGGISREKAP